MRGRLEAYLIKGDDSGIGAEVYVNHLGVLAKGFPNNSPGPSRVDPHLFRQSRAERGTHRYSCLLFSRSNLHKAGCSEKEPIWPIVKLLIIDELPHFFKFRAGLRVTLTRLRRYFTHAKRYGMSLTQSRSLSFWFTEQ
jgi:hypothetical protein